MHHADRDETLNHLRARLERLTSARLLVEAGESLGALHALRDASHFNRRSIADLLLACFEAAVGTAESDEACAQTRKKALRQLARLASLNLCPPCRRHIKAEKE